MPSPPYVFSLLVTLVFTLATCLQLRTAGWTGLAKSDSVLMVLLGDGRRMFGNHFFVKADVYFHSGYYPSIFDQAAPKGDDHHMAEDHDEHGESEEQEHEHAMSFLGPPRDWIDRFGRHFFPTTHSHLDKPGEAREILPWLKLSAELDPERVETYTVAAYWLRKRLGKVDEAEDFLRQGLRANPSSYEILCELGQLYYENRHDTTRARNLWELALRHYEEQDRAGLKPDVTVCQKITTEMALLEEKEGRLESALQYREKELKVTPHPAAVQQQIDDLKKKMSSSH